MSLDHAAVSLGRGRAVVIGLRRAAARFSAAAEASTRRHLTVTLRLVVLLGLSVAVLAALFLFRAHVKLHFTLDHDGYLPTALVITEGKRHEITLARQHTFAPGTILVFDRGYLDFAWFAQLTAAGVFFVTRMKDGASYDVVKRHPVPAQRGVVADEWIVLRTPQSAAKYEPGLPLRRVEVVLPEGDRLVFLTNHLDLGPTTIARIYKDRWQIELLFKALKQNLRVKTFVGTSANALHIQIWTALIALLILKYLQLKATFRWSLSNLVALLRRNLFVYRDLWTWLNEPFTGPPAPPEPVQGVLL